MIFHHRQKGLLQLTALTGLLCCLLCYGAAYYLKVVLDDGRAFASLLHSKGYAAGLAFALLALVFDHLRTSGVDERGGHARPAWSACLATGLTQSLTVLVFLALFSLVTKDVEISRVFVFLFVGLLAVSLTLVHRLVPRLLGRVLFQQRQACRCLLIHPAALPEARLEAERLVRDKEHLGLQIDSSFVYETPLGGDRHTWLARLRQTLEVRECGVVLFFRCVPDLEFLSLLKAACDDTGVRLIACLDLPEPLASRIDHTPELGTHLVSLGEEPLQNPVNRILKRGFDLLVAAPVVVFVLPPLALFVWMAQKRQSPGPLLHRQQRSGLNGHAFTFWKFRTMHPDNGQEGRQATPDDPRIFPLGRWLRRTSLDEMPQFLHVLTGQMSLVGPRPHLVEHDPIFARMVSHYPMRRLIKPGLTGLAQVRGWRGEVRGAPDISERVDADLLYLRNWSLAMDFKILILTAAHVIKAPPSAY